MVKIRLISDLHFTGGINGPDCDKTYKQSGLYHYFGKKLQQETDCVTLIAGDILEGFNKHSDFFNSFFPNQHVIFVEGNHSVYIRDKYTIDEIKQELKKQFPITHCYYHYLENDWMWIPGCNNEVAVIGSTFYTDYQYNVFGDVNEYNAHQRSLNAMSLLYGLPMLEHKLAKRLSKKMILHENLFLARMRLNDFKWGNIYDNNLKRIRNLDPEDYLKMHNEAKLKIENAYNEILKFNPNAKIILMTHHCLSHKCIDKQYNKSKANASYVSKLDSWIDTMPNIKLVFSGHVHCRKDFKFGKNKTRYIINACGYIPYQEPFKPKKFNPNLIIDTNNL